MNPFQFLKQATGRLLDVQGQEYLFFGGTAYLSLATHADYITHYKAGIDRYGLNNGTSRNNNIQQGIYVEAEIEMARRFGFEEATILSSGYLVAQLAVRALAGLGTLIYAPGAHPALWLENKAPAQQDFKAWATATVQQINKSEDSAFVIVANTLDNLSPERYDFTVFKQIDPSKKVYLLLDDSHGIGIAELNGTFVDQQQFDAFPHIEFIVVASLAKGMGTDAGILLSSHKMGILFKRSTFFTGASPCSPAALYALIAGVDIYIDQHAKMQANISYLRKLLPEVKTKIHAIDRFPVFTIAREDAFLQLKERGILISSFPYPLESDPLKNRIVVSAIHTQADIDRLVLALNDMQ